MINAVLEAIHKYKSGVGGRRNMDHLHHAKAAIERMMRQRK
jgi:hypothetical protein